MSSPPSKDSNMSSSHMNNNTGSVLHWVIHAFCIAVYLLPLFTHGYKGEPVLDEAHIVSTDNRDVSGEAPWYEALYNDYWGRPMNSPSSHKSWRPLTIYSFRFFPNNNNAVVVHRCFNVVTHAAVAEILSQLFSTTSLVKRICIKLMFALHPTHVEVVANAANRPHLLACLFALAICDPTLSIQWVAFFEVCGLTCAETFIFTMPAVLFTITYLQRQRQQQQSRACGGWYDTWIVVLPRFMVVLMFTVLYIVGRWILDTLSIPDGLIRPAENPFYEFTGMRRILSYLYVISIHVAKSIGVDFIGFSHEYGRDCIRPVNSLYDTRLLIPLGMILSVVLGIVVVIVRRGRVEPHNQQQRQYYDYWLALFMHLSWMATLFPISGIIKVGTFVADRIVVASTISTSVLIGTVLATWLLQHSKQRLWKMTCVTTLYLVMWYRLHMRSLQWMDSVSLLTSSLETCPRSAKSHLEMSKVHSGLYPNLVNLTKSLEHLKMVQDIDGDFCDVHHQYAHVYIQQNEYLLFEQHLLKALLCPYTMGGSMDLWQRYWKVAGSTPEAQERRNAYDAVIQRALLEDQLRTMKMHNKGI